eukprot:10485206-Prorocentrum_lima.AAC.1
MQAWRGGTPCSPLRLQAAELQLRATGAAEQHVLAVIPDAVASGFKAKDEACKGRLPSPQQ